MFAKAYLPLVCLVGVMFQPPAAYAQHSHRALQTKSESSFRGNRSQPTSHCDGRGSKKRMLARVMLHPCRCPYDRECFMGMARTSVIQPLVNQSRNGEILNRTLFNSHFLEGTATLHPAGQAKLRLLARREFGPQMEVFLQTANDIRWNPEEPKKFAIQRTKLNAERVEALQQFGMFNLQKMVGDVQIFDPTETGLWSAEGVKATREMFGSARGTLPATLPGVSSFSSGAGGDFGGGGFGGATLDYGATGGGGGGGFGGFGGGFSDFGGGDFGGGDVGGFDDATFGSQSDFGDFGEGDFGEDAGLEGEVPGGEEGLDVGAEFDPEAFDLPVE